MMVCKPNEGKKAITEYFLEEKYFFNNDLEVNFYKCKLQTGRTHQIRVHFSHLNSPILGDDKYGKNIKPGKIFQKIFIKLLMKNFLKKKDKLCMHNLLVFSIQ